MRRFSFDLLSFVAKINHHFTLNFYFYYLRFLTCAEGENIEAGIFGGVKSLKCDIIWGASGVCVDVFGESCADIFGEGFFFCPNFTGGNAWVVGGGDLALFRVGKEAASQFLWLSDAVGALYVDAYTGVPRRVDGIWVGVGEVDVYGGGIG